jgi:dephospho-CoA kinase
MRLLGLTGPSGGGKSTVSAFLEQKGIPVINADMVYRQLLIPPSPCLDDLTQRFGQGILTESGELNRKALAAIVFSDADALSDLNRISHGHIMAEVERQIKELEKQGVSLAIFDAPQLFEAGAERLCDLVVSVLAPLPLRLERIMRRDGIDKEAAMRRIQSQYDDEFFIAHSDVIIQNSSDLSALEPQLQALLQRLEVRAQ